MRFTIMEIVVTFGLAGIVIATSMSLLSTSMWGENFLQKRMTATNIARARMESLRSISYNELPVLAEQDVRVNGAGVLDAKGTYFRTTTVEAPYKDTREVGVVVRCSWKYNRPEMVIALATILMDEAVLIEE